MIISILIFIYIYMNTMNYLPQIIISLVVLLIAIYFITKAITVAYFEAKYNWFKFNQRRQTRIKLKKYNKENYHE